MTLEYLIMIPVILFTIAMGYATFAAVRLSYEK